jgi:hypothetical protein
MKPFVIEYLKSHSFEQLELEHGICARPSSNFRKFSINYDMILVKNGDPISNECRGLVIKPTDKIFNVENWSTQIVGDCDVLAWPLNRFYNYGDINCSPVNWSDDNLKVYEKLDGTMCILYWDKDCTKWCVATRSVPEADLPIRKDHLEIGDMTFDGLFWKSIMDHRSRNGNTFFTLREWKTIHLSKNLTYVFELTSPYNRIVVKYDVCNVTLLAVRDTHTGVELNINNLPKHINLDVPKVWSLNNVSSLVELVNSSDPAKLEGAVVCDSNFNRIKVKNKAWVLSSRAKDLLTVSRRSALEAILQGSIDDVLPLLEKDIADKLIEIQKAAREYFIKLDANFLEWKKLSNGSRKTFAEKVIASGDWSAPHFNVLDGKAISIPAWVEAQAKAEKLSPSTLDLILIKIGQAT